MSLIDSSDTLDHDKPYMFKHLANINEDASQYEWPGVRFWSEEVCAHIAEGKLIWTSLAPLNNFVIKALISRQKSPRRSEPPNLEHPVALSTREHAPPNNAMCTMATGAFIFALTVLPRSVWPCHILMKNASLKFSLQVPKVENPWRSWGLGSRAPCRDLPYPQHPLYTMR